MNRAEGPSQLSEQERQEKAKKKRDFLLVALDAFNEKYPTNTKKRKVLGRWGYEDLKALENYRQSDAYNTARGDDFYWEGLSNALQPFLESWVHDKDPESGKTNLEKYLG